jgi:hypothetical protein
MEEAAPGERSMRMKLLALVTLLAGFLALAAIQRDEPRLPLMPPGDESAELMQECGLCHFEFLFDMQNSAHLREKIGCPSCHGPSRGHRESENNDVSPDVYFSVDQREKRIEKLCATCHADSLQNLKAGEHNGASPPEPQQAAECISCHAPHE